MIMFAETSAQAWTTLSVVLLRTTAHSSQIRAQLSRIKKQDSSAVVYYKKVK
jgi:hypothetical protein